MKKINFCGTYTDININSNTLIKTVYYNNLNSTQQEVLKIINFDYKDLLIYQEYLLKFNFPFEKIYDLKKLNGAVEFKQKFLYPAKNIDELLFDYFKTTIIDYNKVFVLFKRVMELWKLSHSQREVFVDFNLRNFIVYNENIILVDLFPPLIASKIDMPTTAGVRNQIELWLDDYINVASMMCYFLQPLIINNKPCKNLKPILNKLLQEMLNIFTKVTKIDRVKLISYLKESNHVFAKRFLLLYNNLQNDVDFYDEFLQAKLF